ncbi:MAG: heavy metal sensor histidine kinase [Planctomycetota bacterium]
MSENTRPVQLDRGSRWPRTLAGRLTLSYVLASAVLVSIVIWIAFWAVQNNVDAEDDRFLADQVHVIRMVLEEHPDDRQALVQEAEWEVSARRHSSVFVRVMDSSGEVVLETSRMPARLTPIVFPDPVAADRLPSRGVETNLGDQTYRLMAARAILGQSGEKYTIQIALDHLHQHRVLSRYRRQLLLGGALFLLFSSMIVYWLSRRGLRSIREVSALARDMRATRLTRRLEIHGAPKETAELATTFNSMLDRLADSFDRLSQFSSGIAHELRTPVNNLLGTIEVNLSRTRTAEEYRGTLESCAEECQRLAHLIESLLFIARSEHPQAQIEGVSMAVRPQLESLADFYRTAANEGGVRLELDCHGDPCIFADPPLFQRAIGNLLENSLRYTPEGGVIRVTARAHAELVTIEVIDTGSGIERSILDRVFDPLFRGEPSRSVRAGGIGLGLTIVQTILRLHGGSVEIQSQPGTGTRVTMTWPMSRASGSSAPGSARAKVVTAGRG